MSPTSSHPKLDRSVSAAASLRSSSKTEDFSETDKEFKEGNSTEEDTRDRPSIARQTSLKELPSSSRKSCEAIPEESKEVEGVKTEDTVDIQPHPRERVYTMPALNMQRRGNASEPSSKRNSASVDSALKDASSGSNPRFKKLLN